MIKVHLLPEGAKSKADHNIECDLKDPNFYCRSCQKHYSDRSNYRQHIRTLHTSKNFERREDIKSEIIDTTTTQSDTGDNKDKMCTICGKRYASKWSHQYHINKYHKDA